MGEKSNEVKSWLFDSALEVAVDYGKEATKHFLIEGVKNTSIELGANLMVDTVGAMIPGVGSSISSYRTSKKINNINKLMEELSLRQKELKHDFDSHCDSNKEMLDNIFDMILEKTSSVHQQEKIKYIVNGYSQVLKVENPSFDTAYLFFDTLDKLTVLDISVLKLSYNVRSIERITGHETYSEIMEEFDIDSSQYTAVRENLYRLGLLENDFDNKLDKDLTNMKIAITELRDVTKSIADSCLSGKKIKIKKLTDKSKIKLVAKDRLKISNFGRQFITFFIK